MEDGDTEKYHASSVIQDFVFLSQKKCCIRCISLQVQSTLDTSNFKGLGKICQVTSSSR